MNEDEIREHIRSTLINEKAVEEELTPTYVWALVRKAYADGYLTALTTPVEERPELEEVGKVVASQYLRLPIG